jgi:site-specific recombinase XerD
MSGTKSSRRPGADQSTPRQLSLFDLPDEHAATTSEAGAPQHSVAGGALPEGELESPDALVHTRVPGSEWTTEVRPSDPALSSRAGDTGPLAMEPERRARPQATRLKAAIEEYKQYLAALNRSKHTRDSFGLDLKLLLEHLGDVPLHDIAERDLRSFISWVSVQRNNSAISVRRKVASLKNFFAYLHNERAISHDPALRLIYPEIYPALPEFLEDEKAADLLAAAEEHPFWRALTMLMMDTGLKRDEVVALGRVDVSLTDSGEGSYLVVRETEAAKRLRSRRLEISAPVAAVLTEYLAGQPDRERFFDVSARGVNFIVETCGKRAHIATRGSKLTPQILRETYAVRQMRALSAAEDALRAAGHTEDSVAAVMDQHDLQLLRLLGLHEEPESAKKYRKLVRGWTTYARP